MSLPDYLLDDDRPDCVEHDEDDPDCRCDACQEYWIDVIADQEYDRLRGN